MAGETILNLVGNLTADPELRFTPSGSGVANFTIAATPRTFDRQSNEWKDGETLFMRCNAWRELSENVAETLTKGMRVMVSGRLKSRSYETKEGEKRTVMELEVDEVGPSLKYATAQVQRTQRNGQGGGQQQQQGYGNPWDQQQGQQAQGQQQYQQPQGQQQQYQQPQGQQQQYANQGQQQYQQPPQGQGYQQPQGGGDWGNGQSNEPPF